MQEPDLVKESVPLVADIESMFHQVYVALRD